MHRHRQLTMLALAALFVFVPAAHAQVYGTLAPGKVKDDNPGVEFSDPGGVLDSIQGSAARERVLDSGRFDFGAYLAQLQTTGRQRTDPDLVGQPPAWVDNYVRPARRPGGQFAFVSEIVTNSDNTIPPGQVGKYAVGIYGAAATPPNNPGTSGIFGGNTLAHISAGAAWPDTTRGFEVNVNNLKEDAPPPAPGAPGTLANSVAGLDIVFGGNHLSHYGWRVGAINPAGKPRVGGRIGSDGWQFRALELHDPPVAQGLGLIVGQALSSIPADTLNFARDTDRGLDASSNFIRLRTADLATNLFRVDNAGSVWTNGQVVLGNSCPIRAGSGSPEGVVTASPCALYLRTDGAAGSVLYVKERGSNTKTGWVAK